MTQLRTNTRIRSSPGLLVPTAAALLITHVGRLTHGLALHGAPKALLLAPASKLWRH